MIVLLAEPAAAQRRIGSVQSPIEVGPQGAAPGERLAFGAAVAISGNGAFVAVGAPEENERAGATYVFVRTATGWTQQAKLAAGDGQAGAQFGLDVAIDGNGDVVAVGAPWRAFPLLTGASLSGAGAVYVFTRSGTTWSEQARLTASDRDRFDNFGNAVSLSGEGTTIVVGAPRKEGGEGRLYVLTRSPTSPVWVETSRLRASRPSPDDFLGHSVEISEDSSTIAAGAPGDDDDTFATRARGAAYVYVRVGSSWSPVESAKLTASDGGAADGLGLAIAISLNGALVVAGAPRHPAGAAYIFQRGAAGWQETSEQTKLVRTGASSNAYFGGSAAIRDISGGVTSVLLGAPDEDAGGFARAGVAYLFRRSGSTWTRTRLAPPDPRSGDGFGIAVAIPTGTGSFGLPPIGVIGAYLGSTNGGRPGSIYVVELTGPFAPSFDVLALATLVASAALIAGAAWFVLRRRPGVSRLR